MIIRPNEHVRGKVLIVDDEPTIGDVVSRYLRRAGYVAEVAATGQDALKRADSERPDVVVLDLMLPDVEGLEVMRRLRAQDRKRAAIILLTARGEESDRIVGLRLGADDYVVKPFSPAELVARVDALLRRLEPVPERQPPLVVDELEIDPGGRRVLLGGAAVDLTLREFELLLFLARHRGQAFTRDQLMENVWQYPFYVDTSTVTVHIRRLRAKLERDPRPSAVHPDGVGNRVPVRPMRRVAAHVVLAVLVAVAVAAIAWAVYGRAAFITSVEILAPLGAVTALIAEGIAHRPPWIPGLRNQLGALAVVVAAQLAVAVALFAALMFVSPHDAFFMALVAAYAALIGLAAARLLARRALTDLDAIRAALTAVGEGARDVRIPVRGADELGALAAEVETTISKVATEERARQELVASVSHDLRTPITTVQLIAEALEDNLFEPELAREKLRLISTHVRALSSLIDDLFELSRLEAGEVHWSMEQVRIDELVRETVDAMRPKAEADRISMRTELEDQLTAARGNAEQLQRVLFNLIQNAIRHTPADGSLVVRAAGVPGPAIEVEVADSGKGIDPELRERIFEPFVQGPSRVAGANGSAGLGLAIARAIVEAHGGRIWLSETAPGTRIRFSLPAV